MSCNTLRKARRLGCLLAMLTSAFALASISSAQPGKEAKLPDGVKVLKALPYVKDGNDRQKLDLYLPKADGPVPVIIWIHGGAWSGGGRENPGQALAFVGKGYALASITHSYSQQAIFPAQIEDCRAVVRWLRANAKTHGLDPDHIAAWGASSGGHLAALLGTSWHAKDLDGKISDNLEHSSRIQAVVDFFGPTDFLQMDVNSKKGGLKHDPANSPESKLIGGPIQQNKEKTQRANPITYINKDTPPFIIAHGEIDNLVPIHQSELLEEALKKAGIDVAIFKLAGAGHGGPQFGTEKMQTIIGEFLDKNLKPRLDAKGKSARRQ